MTGSQVNPGLLGPKRPNILQTICKITRFKFRVLQNCHPPTKYTLFFNIPKMAKPFYFWQTI